MLYISILWNSGKPGFKAGTDFNCFFQKLASERLISLTDILTGEVSPSYRSSCLNIDMKWLTMIFGIFGLWTFRRQDVNWAFFKYKITHLLKTVGWVDQLMEDTKPEVLESWKVWKSRFFKTNGTLLHLRVVKIMVRKAKSKFARSETPWGFRLSPKCKNRIVFSQIFSKTRKMNHSFRLRLKMDTL